MNNSLTLIGRVGQDLHTVNFPDTGNKVVKFSIAVKEFSPNKEDETMWIDVDAWNGLGDRALNLIKKGREVVVFGRLALSTFSREVDGVKLQTTKPVLKLTSFHLCGARPADTAADQQDETIQTLEEKTKTRGFRRSK